MVFCAPACVRKKPGNGFSGLVRTLALMASLRSSTAVTDKFLFYQTSTASGPHRHLWLCGLRQAPCPPQSAEPRWPWGPSSGDLRVAAQRFVEDVALLQNIWHHHRRPPDELARTPQAVIEAHSEPTALYPYTYIHKHKKPPQLQPCNGRWLNGGGIWGVRPSGFTREGLRMHQTACAVARSEPIPTHEGWLLVWYGVSPLKSRGYSSFSARRPHQVHLDRMALSPPDAQPTPRGRGLLGSGRRAHALRAASPGSASPPPGLPARC